MWKMSEAANLVFERIFILNSVKHKFFYVSIIQLEQSWQIVFLKLVRITKGISPEVTVLIFPRLVASRKLLCELVVKKYSEMYRARN